MFIFFVLETDILQLLFSSISSFLDKNFAWLDLSRFVLLYDASGGSNI